MLTPIRTVRGGVQRWWQPVLPALASEMAHWEPGKGRKRKRMQQKRQQIISMHARRKEGERRNRIMRTVKWQDAHDKVRGIYEQYAAVLKGKAVAGPVPPSQGV